MKQLFFTVMPILVTVPLLICIKIIKQSDSKNHERDKTHDIKRDVQRIPSTISMFDEIAYQKALENKGLNESLCSPVLTLKVGKE